MTKDRLRGKAIRASFVGDRGAVSRRWMEDKDVTDTNTTPTQSGQIKPWMFFVGLAIVCLTILGSTGALGRMMPVDSATQSEALLASAEALNAEVSGRHLEAAAHRDRLDSICARHPNASSCR